LHTLATSHPEWSIAALLRREPPAFKSTYPNIKVIHGDYDSTDLISQAAEEANIVVHCGNSDHESSLNAIIAGLKRREQPGFLLHLSGTGIVSDWADEEYLGRLNPKVWSDLDAASLSEIRGLPDGALHRNTEKILHSTVREQGDKINVAVMCPPDIYGRGKGMVKTKSALIPMFVDESKKLGSVFHYGEGTNTRSWVHIDDLMRLYSHVVEVAARNEQEEVSQYFGENGYHFASTQMHSHIEVARAVGKLLAERGVLKSPEPVQIDLRTLDGMANIPHFPKLARYLYASNSMTMASRAKKLWGYMGEGPGLLETLEADVVDALGGDEN
jgi:nucleoside-diphosphate-sugar epimerase